MDERQGGAQVRGGGTVTSNWRTAPALWRRAAVTATALACVTVLAGCSGGGSSTGLPGQTFSTPGSTGTPTSPSPSTDPTTAPTSPIAGLTQTYDAVGDVPSRMLGVVGEVLVLHSVNDQGVNVLRGVDATTGAPTWEQSVAPTLATPSTPSATTLRVSAGTVFAVERLAIDEFTGTEHVTRIDAATGKVLGTRSIPKIDRRYGNDAPFDEVGWLFALPDNRVGSLLADGRWSTTQKRDKGWLLATPPGTPMWIGDGREWPSVNSVLGNQLVLSLTDSRAIRRHTAGGTSEYAVQVIDTKARKNIGSGCRGGINHLTRVMVSPSHTWASVGGASLDLRSGTVHCNTEITSLGGRVLAINDEGTTFGWTDGTDGQGSPLDPTADPEPPQYFFAGPDQSPEYLPEGPLSTFNPEPYVVLPASGAVPDQPAEIELVGDTVVLQGRGYRQ